MNEQEKEVLKNAFEMLPDAFTTSEGTQVRLISLTLLESIVNDFGDLRYKAGITRGTQTASDVINSVLGSVFNKKKTEEPLTTS